MTGLYACLYVCLVRTLLSHHFPFSNDENFQLYSKPWRRRVTLFLFSLAHDKVVLLCANLVLKTDSNTCPNYVAAVTIQSSRYSRICLKLNVKHTYRKTQTVIGFRFEKHCPIIVCVNKYMFKWDYFVSFLLILYGAIIWVPAL